MSIYFICCFMFRMIIFFFFFSSRSRHTRSYGDWSSDVCSSDLGGDGRLLGVEGGDGRHRPEDLLLEQARVAGDVGQDGGLIEVAAAVAGAAPDHGLRAPAD